MTVSVLIADDHPLFRRGVRDLLEAEGYVCIEAGDGIEALEQIRKAQPDIALLDLAMPGGGGLQVIEQAKRWPDAPRFVILTLYDDSHLIERAFDLGTSAYLLKENAEDELLRCLDTVCAGSRYLSHSIAFNPEAQCCGPEAELARLTSAEQRIVRLVAEYKTSREISEHLNISVRTVQNHRAHIAKKLGLHGRHALLHFAVRVISSLSGRK
jgi:DNA-binding NarL/FixJ family response regulator